MIMEDNGGQKSAGGRSGRSWPLFPVVFFLIMAAISLLLHFEKSSHQKKVSAARQKFSRTVIDIPIDMVKARRSLFYETSFYLGYAWRNSHAAADFIRRLNGIVRLPLNVLDLKIVPGWQNFRFELHVGIAVEKPEPAQKNLKKFCQSLQNLFAIGQLTFSEPAPPVLLPGQAAKGSVFSISGQVELE